MSAHFFFAMVDSSDSTWSNTFKRNDCDVFSFEMIHEEGNFPRLEIEVKNPLIGLLDPSRKQWCWLSYENGSTFETIFFGRMIAAPEEMSGELMKLTYIARPLDFNNQKSSLANSLKTLPLFDPIWITSDKWNDPDVVLETRPILWHIDRKTNLVSYSNITSGEDGVIDLGSNVFDGSLDISYSSPPLSTINVKATANWVERQSGVVNITPFFNNPIWTITGEGLIEDWPDYGTDVGGGWKFGETIINRLDGSNFTISYTIVNVGTTSVVYFPNWALNVQQNMEYNVERVRSEILNFSINANVQQLYSDASDETIDYLDLSTDYINRPVDDGVTPLINGVERSYFQNDRGHLSIAYIMALAQTKLTSRARAIRITGETTFENGLAFSCRKDVMFSSPKIPNGSATGKIVGYILSADGSSGELKTSFTLASTIGLGSPSTIPSAGTAAYVDTNYVSDFQIQLGATVQQSFVGDVTWTLPDGQPINDDNKKFPLTAADSVAFVKISKILPDQYDKVQEASTYSQAVRLADSHYTQIELLMKEIQQGPFNTSYTINTTNLNLPKQINLG